MSAVLVFWLYYVCSTNGFAGQNPIFEFERTFGSKGIGQGELNAPESITVDLNGNIYIADTGNNRIQKFSADGKYLTFTGGFGWNAAQFDEPAAIWAKNGLNVLVADKNNHRIVLYDRNLNIVSTYDKSIFSDESKIFRYPVGIARSDRGEMFVIDSENTRVIRLNSFGVPVNSFGGYNSSGKPLVQPVKVVVKDSEWVYVSDAGRKEIVVYDYYGNYHNAIGSDIFGEPAGMDVDENGVLYVCDISASQIIVINTGGQILAKLSHPSIGSPVDIAYSQNRIYIIDRMKARVSVFKVEY